MHMLECRVLLIDLRTTCSSYICALLTLLHYTDYRECSEVEVNNKRKGYYSERAVSVYCQAGPVSGAGDMFTSGMCASQPQSPPLQ